MRNSIVRRWRISILGTTIFITVAIAVFTCIFVKENHYNIVEATLRSRANSLVMTYFDSEYYVYDALFNDMANDFVNDFSDKELMEVWVIDRHGNVVASSSGFSVKDEIYPDYDYALSNDNGIGNWVGKTSTDEKVMALTYILPSNSQGVSGAIRYIISLEDIDSQLIKVFIIVTLLALLVILFVFVSGVFFIKSIIIPVNKINETANKIAKGDFSVSIDKHKYNDEIGTLCKTINNMAYEIGETERIKNEFISTVSHELRTPLTAIKGWGETIRSSSDDSELVNKGIDVIVNESDRLSELVEELLDFSRIESGKFSLRVSEMDIIVELNEVIKAFETRSTRENIELIADIPIDTLKINGDRNRIKQAFVNIIDNAFKYNKESGFVKISLETTDNSVIIKVSDNGCGISRFDLPRIKEKFFKANNSVRGSGIGLAVTDEIIKMHNGEIKIESTVGEGTTVSITLPI